MSMALADPAPVPASAATVSSGPYLGLTLRQFKQEQLRDLICHLIASDGKLECAASALAEDMAPRDTMQDSVMDNIKLIGPSDLREMALAMCLVSPDAQALATAEAERIKLAQGQEQQHVKQQQQQPESPTTTATTTATASSSSSATGGSSGEGQKKSKRRRIKDALIYFLESAQYMNEGNMYHEYIHYPK